MQIENSNAAAVEAPATDAARAAEPPQRANNRRAKLIVREIAETALSPEDLQEQFIHSLQRHVEVDEPETEAAPALTPAAGELDGDTQFDRMTEEDLLRGLEGLVPPAEVEDDGE